MVINVEFRLSEVIEEQHSLIAQVTKITTQESKEYSNLKNINI